MSDNLLEHCLDKQYENTPREKVLGLPIEAIQGISERQAVLLKEAFGVTTIEQLGRHATFVRAHAMTILVDARSGGSVAAGQPTLELASKN
jgi:hypothetical protein